MTPGGVALLDLPQPLTRRRRRGRSSPDNLRASARTAFAATAPTVYASQFAQIKPRPVPADPVTMAEKSTEQDRRVPDTGNSRNRNVVDRRAGMDRRRGPGRRRGEVRRAAEEGEITGELLEFIMAIDEYKRINGRPFPSWSEVFEIIQYLGYRKVAPKAAHINTAAGSEVLESGLATNR